MIRPKKSSRKHLITALAALTVTQYCVSDVWAQKIDESGLRNAIVMTSMQESLPTEGSITADMSLPSELDGEADAPSNSVISSDVPSTNYAPISQSIATIDSAETKIRREKAMAGSKNAYAGVFYANNFSYLNDPYYNGPRYFSDDYKNIDTRFGTFSFGGESRYRYHNEHNFRGQGITGNDDDFLLTRNRLYADWRLSDDLRVFGELLDANSNGEQFAPRAIEENDLDIQNLFADVKLFDNDYGKFTARVGRQELIYGAERTVSPLDWANTRRTFEGIRGLYQYSDTSIDAFWTEFVPVNPKSADKGDNDTQFYGAYLTEKNTSVGQFEAYYLGLDAMDKSTNPAADFSFHTIGSRVSGSTKSKVLYDFEGAYQFGENANNSSHNAGFITAGLGRKIETDFLSPLVWLYYDYASGEQDFNDVRRGDNGYDHLFPLAHKYNGFMDLFGRRNLHDFNVFTLTPLHKQVSMIVWYHYFRMVESTTPYSVVMTPYNTVTPAQSRDLGHEIDVLFDIILNTRNNVLLGYSHFQAGDYYDAPTIGPADGSNNADFFYAQFQTRY